MFSQLKTVVLAVVSGLFFYLGFKNRRLEKKIKQREVDDLEIEANAKQVIIDDKQAEEAIRNKPVNRHSDLHHFE